MIAIYSTRDECDLLLVNEQQGGLPHLSNVSLSTFPFTQNKYTIFSEIKSYWGEFILGKNHVGDHAIISANVGQQL